MSGVEWLDRSARREVRNPVLALPAMARLEELSPEARAALAAFLDDLADDARRRADECWRKHKAPMAAYWKAASVYARHLARAARGGLKRVRPRPPLQVAA